MNKITMLITLLILTVTLTLSSDEVADSLVKEIESLPYSYLKGDKIWDLALYQDNALNKPEDAIMNFLKASEMFMAMDSLASAIKTNGSVMIIAYNHPEFYDYSKQAFTRDKFLLDNKDIAKLKLNILTDIHLHLSNAYFMKEMEYLQEKLLIMENYFDDEKYDSVKFEYDQLLILATNYFYGEEKALEKSMQIYEAIEKGEYKLDFGMKSSMKVKILSVMQNFYYYRGDIEQSNKLLDEAMAIALDVYTNHIDSLSQVKKKNFRTDISQLMTLKIDNIKIEKDNLSDIEQGYLEVNKFAKSFDKEREINNFVKIAHAYDVIYSGNNPKTKVYLDKAERGLNFITNSLYLTNFYLTKARYSLNNKNYKEANIAFLEVEKFIDKTNQSWIKFNYILERSRYYFEVNQPKKGYDMVTEFYTNIDKDFSNNIAEKTAELNNLIETKDLKNEKIKLEKELEIKTLRNSRENLVTTLVGIVLGFTTLLLINNVRLNKKLKYSLTEQSQKLQEEICISQQRAEELIVTEKLSTTGQIASSIAHEIKNPLTNIITASKLLRSSQNSSDIEKYNEICVRNSWIAIEKVNSLLEYAKQKKMNFQECSLKDVLKDAYSLTKGSLEEKKIKFNLIYKAHDDNVKIDKKELTGVVVNLILNSVQALDINQDIKQIEVILSKENDDFIIEVADNGPGIAPEVIAQVFNPFFTTKEAGTGLGLNYALKVVAEHHGKIEVESEINNGTQVFMRIPKRD